jgi:hypothetical protein
VARAAIRRDRLDHVEQLADDLVAEVVAFKYAHDLVDSEREIALSFERTELAWEAAEGGEEFEPALSGSEEGPDRADARIVVVGVLCQDAEVLHRCCEQSERLCDRYYAVVMHLWGGEVVAVQILQAAFGLPLLLGDLCPRDLARALLSDAASKLDAPHEGQAAWGLGFGLCSQGSCGTIRPMAVCSGL